MTTASPSVIYFDRTAELMRDLDSAMVHSNPGRASIVLDMFDFVMSPAHTSRKVFGPATVTVHQFLDGGLDMIVSTIGGARKNVKEQRVYASEVERLLEEDR